MKKLWMLFFLIPILIFAAYPIYEDEMALQLPELLSRESHSSKDIAKEKQSEKVSTHNGEENAPKEGKKRQKDRPHFRDQKAVKSERKSEPALEETKQSPISKRDPMKRNSGIQSSPSRSKLRQNPNRPRVIQRQEQNQPQNLSKIEADAEEIENGLSTHPSGELGKKEKSSPDSVTAQETDEVDEASSKIDDKPRRAIPSIVKRQQRRLPRKHPVEK
jgi:hypothetical protein